MNNCIFQGHRGARGMLPENTLPSFLEALQKGLHGIELDVVLTGEKQFLVSHEPFFSYEFCNKPNGERMQKSEHFSHNIYRMDYELIRQYDCGKNGHLRYPEQQPLRIHKPLLKDILTQVEAFVKEHNLPKPSYTIEIKSDMAWYGFMQPLPLKMVLLFMEELTNHPVYPKIKDRLIVESFDIYILNALYEQSPEFEIGFLVENPFSIAQNLERINFKPDIYVPYYRLLDEKKVDFLHKRGIKVFTWTVNKTSTMKKLVSWGVDGIITDFPNRVPAIYRHNQTYKASETL